MDTIQCRKTFIQYVKNFDMQDEAIMRKFHHSFRVMNYAYEIAKSIHLSEEDQNLALVIGLYHDIGRFSQWTEYKTYEDRHSIDHADLGEKIIKDQFLSILSDDREEQQVICKAIRNHNKLYIEKNMNEKETLFSKIIRDADKLDIMMEQNNQIHSLHPVLNPHFIASICNQQLCDNQYVTASDEDAILRQLAFVFDLHFPYTYQYLLNKEVLEKKFQLLESCFPQDKQILKIKTMIFNYVKAMC